MLNNENNNIRSCREINYKLNNIFNSILYEENKTENSNGSVYTLGSEVITPAKVKCAIFEEDSILKHELDYLESNHILTNENMDKAKLYASIYDDNK
jgi:hypothetical protein